ncbi:F-box protein CPR1 isoform X2 [Spinacia oleracea]|nr:F-box protein CPR1-like isoform X2 [Spinacia oleracea]
MGSDVYVAGSCRGLLCFFKYSYPFTVFLYNPTTKKHKTLPLLPLKTIFRRKRSRYLGFGYDHVSEDYKCARMFQLKSDDEMGTFKSQVMVYSLRANSWRQGVQEVPHHFDRHFGYCVHFNGILHWSVRDEANDNRVPLPIVSFDLYNESFSTIPMPSFRTEMYLHAHIGALDDSLCLMINYLEECDVWIMKEYSRPASWTKLFRFQKQQMYQEFRPLSFSTSKKQLFVLLNLYDVASLDLETLEITKVQLSRFHKVLYAYVCPENLLMFKDAEDVLVGTKRRNKNSKRGRLMRRTDRLLQHHDSFL